jgi:hypothetical protein
MKPQSELDRPWLKLHYQLTVGWNDGCRTANISGSRNYSVKQGENEKDLTDFLKDVFSSSYSEFLVNSGTEQLMASLEV